MKHEFPVTRPVEAHVELRSGDLRIIARPTTTATVEVTGSRSDSVVVEAQGDRIKVVEPRRTGFFPERGDLQVTVTVPEHSDLVAKLGSATVRGTGDIGSARVSSGAGDISLAAVGGEAVLKTGAGDISVESLAAESEIKAGAGTISVGRVAGTDAAEDRRRPHRGGPGRRAGDAQERLRRPVRRRGRAPTRHCRPRRATSASDG